MFFTNPLLFSDSNGRRVEEVYRFGKTISISIKIKCITACRKTSRLRKVVKEGFKINSCQFFTHCFTKN